MANFVESSSQVAGRRTLAPKPKALGQWPTWLAEPRRCPGSRKGVDLLIGEVAGHDGKRNGIIAGGASDSRHQRARPFGTRACGKDENENIFILVDEL